MYFSIIAVVLILMNTYFLTQSRDIIFQSKKNFIETQAFFIASNLSTSFPTSLSIDGVFQVMDALDVTGLTHITIVGIDGNALYDNKTGNDKTDPNFFSDSVNQSLAGNDVFSSSFSDGAFSSSAFTPVSKDGGAPIGVVYVHEYDTEQGQILLRLQSTIQNISLVIALLSVIMVGFVTWTIMHRITSILKAIESVREGEYNYRIQVRGNDELALLGDEFNSLTDRLRETEEIRRRFVADASHELKTPLASIRLLSDSILQNEGIDTDTVQEFVSDIGTEAERLSRTTEKLMSLTRLDANIVTARETVDVRSVITSTMRMLNPLAESRGLKLDAKLDGGCFVYSTEDDIYQIVFNLVENAIKYNLPGGSVTVTLTREESEILLTVDDTGIGVPEPDLPYIFDRFYRVDKARSRASGGSGLGLSIVRATVQENNGTITAQRRESGGMRFEVIFPLYVSPQTDA
ncbi:Signal transduction histidine kinase [Sporobacter termitidis DSM 10068]|uniref:histidine kinase n=2 Tax=Sporobacter TaxID=44748 RepID=A0A1M5U4J3_9FIRM|nr:Signal transduction histidine kinase [Sporobacter termitidis DSM 10068]